MTLTPALFKGQLCMKFYIKDVENHNRHWLQWPFNLKKKSKDICSGLNDIPPKFLSPDNFRMWPYLEVGSLQVLSVEDLEMRPS